MTIATLLNYFLTIINTYVIPLIIALTIIVFFWGIYQYVKGGGADEHKKGLNTIMAGIIGLVVMLSVWGIVALVSNSLGVSGSTTITLPTVQ